MVEVMPEDRIARLMTIRDLVAAGQQAPAGPALPDNTMRNNDTGATYSFQSQAPGAAYQPDYANPIEIAGAGLILAGRWVGNIVGKTIFTVVIVHQRVVGADGDRDLRDHGGIGVGVNDVHRAQHVILRLGNIEDLHRGGISREGACGVNRQQHRCEEQYWGDTPLTSEVSKSSFGFHFVCSTFHSKG